MKESKLLVTMFETARWQELLDRATEKEIDLPLVVIQVERLEKQVKQNKSLLNDLRDNGKT